MFLLKKVQNCFPGEVHSYIPFAKGDTLKRRRRKKGKLCHVTQFQETKRKQKEDRCFKLKK